MKKLIGALLVLTTNVVFASTVDLTTAKYSCNSKTRTTNTVESALIITINTTESALMTCKNAKKHTELDPVNDHSHNRVSGDNSDMIQDDDVQTKNNVFDKISFTNDKNVQMTCYYKNSKLVKCTK